MLIRSKVPLRISFAGGGTDVDPYCSLFGGSVLNATINRFATVKLNVRDDNQIFIKSIDYDKTINFDVEEEIKYNGHLDLIKGVIDKIRNKYELPSGFDLYIQNDAPPGSGLGSSSAICVALIGAFQEWLHLPLTPYDIADLAYVIEREELGIHGGRQDQYTAAFGGFNFMEFYKGKTIVNPLKLRKETINELTHSLVIAYVGGSHNSSEIIEEQIKNIKKDEQASLKAFHETKEFSIEAKNLLVTGKLGKFGLLIDKAWKCKQKFASGITSNRINTIYDTAKKAGALGGKISGAGGGGFMFFFADRNQKYSVIEALKKMKLEIVNYTIEDEGLRTWRVQN